MEFIIPLSTVCLRMTIEEYSNFMHMCKRMGPIEESITHKAALYQEILLGPFALAVILQHLRQQEVFPIAPVTLSSWLIM